MGEGVVGSDDIYFIMKNAVDVKLRKISRKLYFMKSKYLKQGVNIEEFVNWSTIQKVFFVLFCYIS